MPLYVQNGKLIQKAGKLGTSAGCCCGSTSKNCCPVSLEYVSKGVSITGKALGTCLKELQSAFTTVNLISRGTPCQYFITVSNFYSSELKPDQCFFNCVYNYEYGPLAIGGSCKNGSGCALSIGYPADITLTKSNFTLTSETCTAAQNACTQFYSYGSRSPEYWFPDSVSVYYNPLP
jgi:hypothetical protein